VGFDADLIAIGPFEAFKTFGLLDAPEDHYVQTITGEDVPAKPTDEIIVTLVKANTTEQSKVLCSLVGLSWPALVNPQVTQLISPPPWWNDEYIGDNYTVEQLYCILTSLLSDQRVRIYFRPDCW
jgi:hypothetical protein